MQPVASPESLRSLVERALTSIENPRLSKDLLAAGMVRDLAVVEGGRVTFTLLLAREDPATLVRDARKAVKAVSGVSAVTVNVAGSAGGGPASRVADGVPPPPTPIEQPNLGRVLAVSSGKGGVGKSTVSANLATALAQAGFRVGLMDADIYGPNIPRMMGVSQKPAIDGARSSRSRGTA